MMGVTAVEITIVIQIVAFAMMFGGLRQLVKSNETWLSEIAAEIKGHTGELSDHKERIGAIEKICKERHERVRT